jgi:predicted GIY-YIG superfamily endonuclease
MFKDINNKAHLGSTNNLERRIEECETGKVFSTKSFQDPELIYF